MTSNARPHNVNLDLFARLKIYSEASEEIPIFGLLDDGPVIFIFLRHFSCIACRALAKNIWMRREQFEKSKARLIFIGNGSPEFIRDFKKDLSLQGHTQGKWDSRSGAHTQMGGIVAFRPPGKVVYHFISNYLGNEGILDFDNISS